MWIGRVERLRELFREQAELARIAADGQTPLMWLPDDERQAVEIVDLFLSHGADPALRTKDGKTAADIARARALDGAAERLERGAAGQR